MSWPTFAGCDSNVSLVYKAPLWCYPAGGVADRIMPLVPGVYSLILRTYEYVPLHGKINFVNVIKFRILVWEEYPESPRWAQCNHECL